jgi:N-acetylglucosaminyldiphosphoundecaprenol N-acetyl-beta-D-mannosaminyltransferase
MSDALRRVQEFIREGVPRLVVTLDAGGLVLAARDPEWAKLLESADLITPDSSGIVWALRRSGLAIGGRVAGCDMAGELCRLSQQHGYRVYLLGGAPGVAEKAACALTATYPGCSIVGFDHGYFQEAEEPEVLSRIANAKPDILLVAMGMPRQEKWIARHRERLGVPVSIGVGGTLDVFAGVAKRAPRAFQRLGLEWLWRVARNPRKMRKVLSLPTFVLMVLRNQSVV